MWVSVQELEGEGWSRWRYDGSAAVILYILADGLVGAVVLDEY